MRSHSNASELRLTVMNGTASVAEPRLRRASRRVAEINASKGGALSWTTRIGTTLAGFRIEGLLGRGGMSVVYLAEDRLGRKVALKVLAPTLSTDEESQLRFRRESRMAASLEHPNIVPVYDAGEEGGMFYISMRYVDGSSLETLIDREGPLAVGRMLSIVEQIAGALDATHRAGLVHRDVKPANILIDVRSDRAYLSDFGIVKHTVAGSLLLTSTGSFVGSPDYCAPEQIEGQPVDARTDVYALGGVVYTCLTGFAPYERGAQVAVMNAHLIDPPPVLSDRRPDLPSGLGEVVATAMAKGPDDRYDSCSALARALRAAAPPVAGSVPAAAVGSGAAPVAALWLVLHAPDNESHDLRVDAGATATVGDLARALARHVGRPSSPESVLTVYCTRLGEWLNPGAPLATADLRRGDRLSLGHAGDEPAGPTAPQTAMPDGAVRLAVSAGPACGYRFILERGSHTVGRDESSDVVLDDPSLSRRHLHLDVTDGHVLAEDAGSSNGTFIEGVPMLPRSPRAVADGDAIVVGRSVLRLEHDTPGSTPQVDERTADLRARRAAAPDAPELLERVRRHAAELWERGAADADFLELRVGVSDLSLRSRADRQPSIAPALPVTVPLREVGVLALAGSEARTTALARWLVVQACILHSPSDLMVAAAVPAEQTGPWAFLKWLPHTMSAASPIAGPHLAAGEGAAAKLMRAVAQLADERARAADTDARDEPALLVLLDERAARDRGLRSHLLAAGPSQRIFVVWIGQDARYLPSESRAICDIDPAVAQLALTLVRSGERIGKVTADGLSGELATEAALGLAPLAAAGTGRLRSIPRRISLPDLLALPEAGPGAIAARWRAAVGKLSAVIGMTADGPFAVDLGRPEGLCALIAGLPGSGKSELLGPSSHRWPPRTRRTD